ncbi:MAG: RluA family pseudouridine synthase [Rickettsiales bacterium]|jgi:23S rRNA pseudouridine1911/1915/1917 synthase
MNKKNNIFTVNDEDIGARLDKFLTACLPDLSRARVQSLLASECVTCNGKPINNASAKIKLNQEYQIIIPEIEPSHIPAQAMDLDIIYEDEHLLIINKQAGLTVHPAPGNRDKTLVNALLAHCGDSLSGIGGVARPGIVHRIDKLTSGLLVVAKHDIAHAHLSSQLADHTLGRTYTAIIWGEPRALNSTITGNIGRSPTNRQKMAVVKTGGKPAITHYKTIEKFDIATLMECNLETGRTHQIRVHFLQIGNSLIGDPTYGQTTQSRLNQNIYKHIPIETRSALLAFNRQALHARELRLIHPHSNKEMTFSCPLPADMVGLLDVLR